MSSLTSYNGLEVVTPSPLAGAGGVAINDNFIALSTKIATTIPSPTDDSDSGYSEGSRWYDSGTTVEFICTDATPGAAVWKAIAAAAYLALGGGTMSGTIEMAGNNLNMNTGAGTGGGDINMDSGNIANCSSIGGPGGFIGIGGPPASATWTATINGHTNIIGELLVNNILQDTGVRNSFYCTSITQLTGDSDVTLAINAFSSPPYALTEWRDSSGNPLITVAGDGTFILRNSHTPASSTATGTAGTIAWYSSYIYVCVAANTWKRVALSTW